MNDPKETSTTDTSGQPAQPGQPQQGESSPQGEVAKQQVNGSETPSESDQGGSSNR